ncbi:MAG: sigma-70 family RNA polymerase sigma factor [Candidatus Aminicenantes bacterium]|nr:MAG: sigma-70 family RNA polymerase sigma factor [Candidatus Aminicenantes bacterium]
MGAPTRPIEHPEDAVLVRKAQQGDMDAFESLVRRYQHRVYALCRRLTGAHQSADDLAQETFIKAYYALGRFDVQWPLYPWLRRIAVNAGLNYLKARARERPLEEGSRGAAGAFGRQGGRPRGTAGAGRIPGPARRGGGIPSRRSEKRLRPEVPREHEL